MARELRLEDSLAPVHGPPSTCGKTRAGAGRDFWDTPSREASRVQPGGCWPGLEDYRCLPQQGHLWFSTGWDALGRQDSQFFTTQRNPNGSHGPTWPSLSEESRTC